MNFTQEPAFSRNVSNGPAFVLTPEEWQQRVHTASIFAFFGFCGMVFNLLSILLTMRPDMRKNNVNIMVANLSTADLWLSISFVFGQSQFILYQEQLDPTGCRWMAFITFTAAFFDFIFPPFLSMNRYICLYRKEFYDSTYTIKNIIFMVLGSWAFCAIVPLIFVLNGKTGFDKDNWHCCIILKDSPIGWTVLYWLLILVPLIIFCDGAMVICNYKIYKKLQSHEECHTLKNNVVRQNKEILYFLIADMSFPILFLTTYHVAKFALVNRESLFQRRVFTCLYLVNACVRGLVTLTMLRPYRNALRNFLSCCRWKSNSVEPAPALAPAIALAAVPAAAYPPAHVHLQSC